MGDQVFLKLQMDNKEDQEFEIQNDVTLGDLVDFFQSHLQLQIDQTDGIQCVHKPDQVFFIDQFHLNIKDIQRIIGDQKLYFKIVKRSQFQNNNRQNQQQQNNQNGFQYQQQYNPQNQWQQPLNSFSNPFQDAHQTIDFNQQQNLFNDTDQQIKLEIQLLDQQEQSAELASSTTLQEIFEYFKGEYKLNINIEEINFQDAGGQTLAPLQLAKDIQIYNNKRLLRMIRAPTNMILEIFLPNKESYQVQIPLDTRLDELITTLSDNFPDDLTPGITLTGVEIRDYNQQIIQENIQMRQIKPNPSGKHQLYIQKTDIAVEIKYFTGNTQQFEINKSLTLYELLVEVQQGGFIKQVDIQQMLIVKDMNDRIVKFDQLMANVAKTQYGKHYINISLKKEEARKIKVFLKNFKKQTQVEEFKFPDITTLQGALDIIKKSTLFGQQLTDDDDIKLYNINTSQEITFLTQKLSETVIMNNDEIEFLALIYSKYVAAKKYVNIQFKNLNNQVLAGKVETEQTSTISEAIQQALGNIQGKKLIFFDMRYEDQIFDLDQSIKDVFGNNLEIIIGYKIDKPPVQPVQETVPQPFQQVLQQPIQQYQQVEYVRQPSYPESQIQLPLQNQDVPPYNLQNQPQKIEQPQYYPQQQNYAQNLGSGALGFTEFNNPFRQGSLRSNNSSDSNQNRYNEFKPQEPSKIISINIQTMIGSLLTISADRQSTFAQVMDNFYNIYEYELEGNQKNKDLLFFCLQNDINSRINSNQVIKELFPIEDQATIYLQIDNTQIMQVEDQLNITFNFQNQKFLYQIPIHSQVTKLFELADQIVQSQNYQLQNDNYYLNRFDNNEIFTNFKSREISIIINSLNTIQPINEIKKQNDFQVESPLKSPLNQLSNQGNIQGAQGNLLAQNPPNPFIKQGINQPQFNINPLGQIQNKQINNQLIPTNPFNQISVNNPISLNNPINPMNPMIPMNPINPINPMNPMNPINPINPTRPIINLTNPINPVNLVNPVNAVNPINPVNPFIPQNNQINPSNQLNPSNQINPQFKPQIIPNQGFQQIPANPFQPKIVQPMQIKGGLQQPLIQNKIENQQNLLQGQQLPNQIQVNDMLRQTTKYLVKIHNYDQELNIQMVAQRTIQDFENQIFNHLQLQPQEDNCIDLMVNDMVFGKNRQKNTNIQKLFVISQEPVVFEAFYRSFGNFDYTENEQNSIPINLMIIDGNFNQQLQLYLNPQLTLQVLQQYTLDYLAINQKLKNNVLIDIIVNGTLLKPQFLKKPFRMLTEQERYIQVKLRWLDKSDELQI